MWADLCGRVRAGNTDEELRAWLLDREGPHAEHVFDQSDQQRYVNRQIARAREAVATNWERDGNGRIIVQSPQNVRVALAQLGIGLRYDAFADRMLIEGPVRYGSVVTEAALVAMRMDVIERFGFRPSKDFFWDAVSDAARRNTFHPVRDHLEALSWDGQSRLDTWLIDYAGAEDSAYVRAVSALPLIAAVRRVRQPGCKFDEMLILEGEQGTGKSSALEVLAGDAEFFSDEFQLGMSSQKMLEATSGVWLGEIAEMAGMRKSEVEAVKATVSRRTDRARKAYDRTVSEVPRQCVFFGTTNSSQYLVDPTGNRRFWPVAIQRFRLDELRAVRDQLWAEAAAREARGESIRLAPALWPRAAAEQEKRRVEDPWVTLLADVLGDMEGKIPAATVWDEIVQVPPASRTQNHNDRLGNAMRQLGWTRIKRRIHGKVTICYVRGDGERMIFVARHTADGKNFQPEAYYEGEKPMGPQAEMPL